MEKWRGGCLALGDGGQQASRRQRRIEAFAQCGKHQMRLIALAVEQTVHDALQPLAQLPRV